MQKTIIYQVLPRLWGNNTTNPEKRGSLEKNGTGKLSDIDSPTLEYLKWLGCTHVWLTGVIRHATKSASAGCIPSHPQFVKGEAGSPYAITDYYDVNPYLANDPANRMAEFEDLVQRIHDAGLKVLIDFIPNHVARDYGVAEMKNIPDPDMILGRGDDVSVHWSENNDFIYYPGQAAVLPNSEAFGKECDDIRNARLDREFTIVPSWLVDKCRQLWQAAGEVGDRGAKSDNCRMAEYKKAIEKYSALLTPYHEFPAKATGNSYTPTPTVNDWYETVKINYCDFHTRTWDKMLAILKYWCAKGVDGFRCDMVELVPPQFFQWAIAQVKSDCPDIIFVAEVYKKELYKQYVREVGFDFLYDKSGLYDVLRAVTDANKHGSMMPVELWQSAKGITRNWQFLGDLQPYMLNFLENHDEQRFPSDFFGADASHVFAPLYASLYLNRAAFMIYAGEETGESGMDEEGFSGRDGRTTIFDWWSVKGLRVLRKIIDSRLYLSSATAIPGAPSQCATAIAGASPDWPDDLAPYKEYFSRFATAIRFAANDAAVTAGTTYDLCYCNASSDGFNIDRYFAFLRDSGDETIMFVLNFSSVEARMKLFIPPHAFEWLEMEQTQQLNPQTAIEVTVPPYGAVSTVLCTPDKRGV